MDTIQVFIILLVLLIVVTTAFGIAYNKKKIQVNGIKKEINQRQIALLSVKKELESEKERQAAIMNIIGAAVVILDEECQIVTLNNFAETLFRVSTRDASGKTFIALIRDHEMAAIVQRCRDTNQEQKGAVIYSRNKQFLDLTATPFSSGVVVLIQDITNLRRLEKIRQDFIVNISHELRTPIASCKAIVETLQNGALADKKVAKDFLQRLHVETDKLAQMVNELGELSRIESGELILKLTKVNIKNIIVKVADRLQTQADRSGVSIKLDMPPGLPSVTADADRIEQVLINLVHNAIKFTPQNGMITISSEVRDNDLTVSVQDTGTGIPEDDLPHIFERFYKVDKARSSGGTGLGLAIAKHIIQAHNGNIQAESEEGKGSVFIFSLPLEPSPVLNTNLNKK
jgi:two-component system, OmpR family, phosphate regulon sensor histidine kinase PhoR